MCLFYGKTKISLNSVWKKNPQQGQIKRKSFKDIQCRLNPSVSEKDTVFKYHCSGFYKEFGAKSPLKFGRHKAFDLFRLFRKSKA